MAYVSECVWNEKHLLNLTSGHPMLDIFEEKPRYLKLAMGSWNWDSSEPCVCFTICLGACVVSVCGCVFVHVCS